MEREIIVNTNSLLTALAGIGQYTYPGQPRAKICGHRQQIYLLLRLFLQRPLLPRRRKDGLRKSVKQFGLNLYKNVKTAVKQIPVVGSMAREVRTGVSKTLQKSSSAVLIFTLNLTSSRSKKFRRRKPLP